MATTLGTMRSSVYRMVRDESQTFITPADVLEWLNEAQLDLALRLKSLPTTASGAVAAGATTITLPADYAETISLEIGDSEDYVEWVDDNVFDSWMESEESPGHYLGRIFGNTIEIFPSPDSATTYSLDYVARPTAMAVDADTFDLPDDLVPKAVKYAQAHAKYKEGDYDLADRFLEMYERGLPAPSNTQTRNKPGPINLNYAPSAWDYYGSHRG